MNTPNARMRIFEVLEPFSKYGSSPTYISREANFVTISDKTAARFLFGETFEVVETEDSTAFGGKVFISTEKREVFLERELEILVRDHYLLEK
jgi:hypothetical protein